MSTEALLQIRGLHAHYGMSHILHGVDLDVNRGEIVCLLGRNGAGRSTLLKSIMGLVPPSAGEVRLKGKDLAGERSFKIARSGIGFVPEEREVFLNLTVEENMQMGRQRPRDSLPAWTPEQMYDYFPRLKERRDTKAASLSGGEQQMLTMCRTLLGNPSVILIDEPTEGLAPLLVQMVGELITDINQKGVSVLLVEQKLTIALKIAHRAAVMGHGQIVFNDTPEALMQDKSVLETWLAV